MAVDITAIGLGVDTAKLRQGTKDLDAFGRSANNAAGKADQSTKQMGAMATMAGRLAIVLGAAGLTKSLINVIDANTKYNAQLKLATQSQEQFNLALSDVQRIARTAQSDIGSVATLYARLNSSLRDVGVTQAEVARITENVGLALKVSGATASESSSAILQLSQAFASGVLRGEEFNAVSESAPVLMRALAESMGVPIGQLRSMAAEGQITGEVLNRAFGDEKLLEKFRQQAKEVQTIQGAFQQLKNSLTILIGEVNQSTGAGVSFADILSTIARNIESVANVIKGDLKTAFDSILPAYKEFKRLQDLENNRLPQATTPAGGILPQGSRIDEPLRRDLGLINENNNAFRQLRDQFQKFRADNPLKDAQQANEEYAQSIALVRANVLAMNITQEEGQRYEEQLKKELDRASKVIGQKTDEQLENERKRKHDAFISFQNEMLELTQKYQKISNDTENKIIKETREAKIESEKRFLEIKQRMADENFKQAQEAAKKEADAYNKIFERANENLSRSLTDSIIRGFERGEKFIDNFKNAITNAFRGYVVNIGVNFVQNAIGSVVGGIGRSVLGALGLGGAGSAVAADGVATAGILDQAKNIFNVVTKGFDAANIAFEQGIQQFGTFVTEFGSIGESIGGFISQYSSTIATALPYAGSVIKLLQGDVKGAAFTAAGTAIGSAIGGPIGGAIGGFLGSTVGGLFGGDDIPMTGDRSVTTLENGRLTTKGSTFGESSLGGGGGLQATNEAFLRALGGLRSAFGDTAKLMIDTIYRSRTNTQGFLRVNDQVIPQGSQKGISFENFLKKVLGPGLAAAIRQSTEIPLAIRNLFKGMQEYEPITKLIQAVIALNESQTQLSDRFGLTVENAAKLSKETGLLGDELTAFINKLAGMAQSVKTPAQQILEYKQVLTDELGGSLPATIDAFDAVLKSFDTTTEAGRKLFTEMFNIRDAFLQFTQAIGDVKKGVDDSIFTLFTPQQQQAMNRARLAEEFAKFNLAVPQSVQQLIAIGQGIDYTTEAGLTLALAFPVLVQAFEAVNGQARALSDTLNELDINRFTTAFEFNRARIYQASGIPLSMMPSYDVGTSFVPQTGAALIHKGERILTASENQSFMAQGGETVSELRAVKNELLNMRAELQSIAISSRKTYNVMDRQDRDGVLIRDVNQEGNPQIIKVEVVA